MKLRILMIILASTSLASCGGGGYLKAIPGPQKSDVRDIKPFHKLSVSVPAQVDIEVGSKKSDVSLLGQEAVVGAVSSDLKDGTLVIDVKEKNLDLNSKIPLQISVHSPNLDALNVSGAAKVVIRGLKSDSFDMSATGACKAEAGGQVTRLTISSSGACNLDFGKVESKFVKLISSGASTTKVDATDSLDIDVSGASKVRYRGNPKKLEKKVSGVSSIEEYTSN
jgi:hypothetical protein